MGDEQAALDHLARARELDPQSVNVTSDAAYALLDLHRPAEAQHEVARGLAIEPSNATLLTTEALVALAQGDTVSARAEELRLLVAQLRLEEEAHRMSDRLKAAVARQEREFHSLAIKGCPFDRCGCRVGTLQLAGVVEFRRGALGIVGARQIGMNRGNLREISASQRCVIHIERERKAQELERVRHGVCARARWTIQDCPAANFIAPSARMSTAS